MTWALVVGVPLLFFGLQWLRQAVLRAAGVVTGAGFAARKPRVPGNALTFVVGVLLSALGTLWTAEGLGAEWPGGVLSVFGLVVGYGVAALIALGYASLARADRELAQWPD
jgi:uncharacterized membrane protein